MKAEEFRKKYQIVSKGRGLRAVKKPGVNEPFSGPVENKKIKNAKKVDQHGNPVQNVQEWRKTHPNDLLFDSTLEWKVWHSLIIAKIPFKLKETIELQPAFNFNGEKIRPITWTPDFTIENACLFIDAKGYPNDSWPMKLKMVKFAMWRLGQEYSVYTIQQHSHITELLMAIDARITGKNNPFHKRFNQ